MIYFQAKLNPRTISALTEISSISSSDCNCISFRNFRLIGHCKCSKNFSPRISFTIYCANAFCNLGLNAKCPRIELHSHTNTNTDDVQKHFKRPLRAHTDCLKMILTFFVNWPNTQLAWPLPLLEPVSIRHIPQEEPRFKWRTAKIKQKLLPLLTHFRLFNI